MRTFLASFALLAIAAPRSAQRPTYDHVILHARVMDPESGLDAPRNIGIRGSKIAAISASPARTRSTPRAWSSPPASSSSTTTGGPPSGYRFAALDGVTTALELQGGA